MMLIDLPPLEETVSGKELIQIAEARGLARGEAEGEKRGEARGLCEAILVLSKARFQRVPETLRKQILLLPKPAAHSLLNVLDDITSLDALKDWVTKHAAKKTSNGATRRKS